MVVEREKTPVEKCVGCGKELTNLSDVCSICAEGHFCDRGCYTDHLDGHSDREKEEAGLEV